jgi:hypothetical protein
MTAQTSLAKELKRLASERGMSIDLLVEQARDTDRSGYAASTLREMLHEKRTLQIRAIVAFGKALDVDLSDNEEYQLRLVRYLTDESIHDMDVVLANLKSLKIRKLPKLTDEEVHRIPISHRQTRREAVSRGSAAAKPTRRRNSGS